jgi:phosphatidylserine/phosphatidylglycerophosphate/cardiolipin synthase-like enzyme
VKRSVSVLAAVVVLGALATFFVVAARPHDRRPAADAPAPTTPGALTVLPDDGRDLYTTAIDTARHDISIEICVLEDPQILQHLQTALHRGVAVRAIVDRGKYDSLAPERANLARYLSGAGGDLHLSNPIFPRSFPKVIVVDATTVVYGSACLDETTFAHYRDFAQATTDPEIVGGLHDLFDSDWSYSAPPGQPAPPFAPTPPIGADDRLIVGPVNASSRLTALYEEAQTTLDVYTELLGNRSLESELVAAVTRGVHVRLITPVAVNGATTAQQALQTASIAALERAGIDVHVSGPQEKAQQPYMHARAAIVDDRLAYLGSISLSPDSATENREVGLITDDAATVARLASQFETDYRLHTH